MTTLITAAKETISLQADSCLFGHTAILLLRLLCFCGPLSTLSLPLKTLSSRYYHITSTGEKLKLKRSIAVRAKQIYTGNR